MPSSSRHLRPVARLIALCCFLGSAWSCSGTSSPDVNDETSGQPVVIVCTTTMIGDIAREVAGDAAIVHVLFGPTVDPHLFRATRDDVEQLMRADLVFYNGFGLEGYLEPTLRRVEKSGIDLVALAETILHGDEAMQDAGVSDPHVWMDPHLWSRIAPVIADALEQELEPGTPTTDGMHRRAALAEARLLALDEYARTTVQTIPDSARILVTAHDAFRYFGRRYGLQVEGIQGLSTASEGGLQALESLVHLLVDSNIPAVFFESTVSERNVQALIEGAAARGHKVALGGTLHSDAPGSAGTYDAMMRHNIDTIASALRGESGAAEPDRSQDAEVQK